MNRDSDPNPDVHIELICRYLDGTLDPASVARVRAAYAETEDGTSVLDAVAAALRSAPAHTVDPEHRLSAARHAAGLSISNKSPRRSWAQWKVVATLGAGAVCIAGILTTLWLTRGSHPVSAPARTYATGNGQRATVRLDDGTQVTLAPRSTITLASDFGTRERRVRLIAGQVYFDVASRADSPFLVSAGQVTARVLGTRFTVRHFEADRDVIVAVQSGKVAVGRRTPVVLTDNMVARVTDSITAVTTDADVGKFSKWIDGQLVFNNVVASEVTTVLGQWYGLTFRFADSTLRDRHITGVFDGRESQREALQNLKLVLGVRMQFDDTVVTLIPDPTRSSTKVVPRSSERTRPHTWITAEVGR